jgi:hypothetical protein
MCPPILPNESISTQYAGLGEPLAPCSGKTSSGALGYAAAGTTTVTVTIPLVDAAQTIQPKCKRGKWRLRISGVAATYTTVQLIVITVDDGTRTCVVAVIPLGEAAGAQVDLQGETPPIDNVSNDGVTASDLMPLNIINVKALVTWGITSTPAVAIADICLEWVGSN